MTGIRKNKKRVYARRLKWKRWVDLVAAHCRFNDLPKDLQRWFLRR